MAKKDKQVGLKMDSETREKLKTLADGERRTASGYLRELIHRAWDDRERERAAR